MSNSIVFSKENDHRPSISEEIQEKTGKINLYFIEYEQPAYLRTNIAISSYMGLSEIQISSVLFLAVVTDKLNPEKNKAKRPSIINNGKLIEQRHPNQAELNNKIKGKTLEIYYYMNQVKSEVGIREITRIFGYLSPALAAYHLNRLVDFEIVVKTEDNRYTLANTEFKIGKLSNYVQVANIWISQVSIFTFIIALFSLIGLTYLVLGANQKIWAVTFIPLFLTSLGVTLKFRNN